MWWIFANYGRTEDVPLTGVFKVVADNEAAASLQLEKDLTEQGYKFCKITAVVIDATWEKVRNA